MKKINLKSKDLLKTFIILEDLFLIIFGTFFLYSIIKEKVIVLLFIVFLAVLLSNIVVFQKIDITEINVLNLKNNKILKWKKVIIYSSLFILFLLFEFCLFYFLINR